MNRGTLRMLGIIVALLAAALIFIELGDDGESGQGGDLLFPGLREEINEVSSVSVSRAGEEVVVISNQSGQWAVTARDDYPADVGRIRELLLAMADARIVEVKTGNPELHGRLGLRSPESDGSKGTLVTASNGDADYQLVFGNTAQSSFRYARKAGEDQTWLIDQNPEIPMSAGEWVDPDIIDIDASRIRSLTITHPDGETITIRKDAETDDDFVVDGIPEGRELSYSTVANGMGGALNDLDLDDVSRATSVEDAVMAEFETFDGMTVEVQIVKFEDASWISLNAAADGDAGDEAAGINDRLAVWQYQVADYKANLLTRRWEDILKAEAE